MLSNPHDAPAFPKQFHDEGEDADVMERDDIAADASLSSDERRDARLARAEMDRLAVYVRRVAEQIADASAATYRAASELRTMLAQDRAVEALEQTPGMLSARVEALEESLAALKSLFPAAPMVAPSVPAPPAPRRGEPGKSRR